MVYKYDYGNIADQPPGFKKVWVMMEDGEIRQMKFEGSEWFSIFMDYPQVCADTREELLLHMISQQQQRIAEANQEIDRLNGLREVPVGKAGDGGWGNL